MKTAFLSQIKNNALLKAGLLNGMANALKIAVSLITSKITAVYLGPSGLAIIGQFMNISQMAITFSSLGLSSALTKYYSDGELTPKDKNCIISTAFILMCSLGFLAAVFVIFGRQFLINHYLQGYKLGSVLILLGLTVLLFAFNNLCVAILNGGKKYKALSLNNMIASFLSLVVAIMLIIPWGLWGALYGFIISQLVGSTVTLLMVRREPWFSWRIWLGGWHAESFKRILKFMLMALTSMLAISFVQLSIRSWIIAHLSLTEAGYWQGLMRMSELAMSFMTMTLGVYYLPTLSSLNDKEQLKNEVVKGFKWIVPITLTLCVAIYFFRFFIVRNLLSSDFLPMTNLFLGQMIGDVLKISAWLLGYVFLAKAKVKTFILGELTFGVIYYFATVFLVSQLGLIGVSYAYAFSYFFYFLLMLFLFCRYLRK